MANGLNGSFIILQTNGKYDFIKREKDGLWDIPGGGYDIKEINYRKVAKRELEEETGITCEETDLTLCATLGQQLRESDSLLYGGVTHGYVFLHSLVLYKEPIISLSSEHTEHRRFTYEEVLQSYKTFKSGPLWLFFTFLEYQRTGQIQEGLIRERRIWQGKEYI